MIEKPWEEEGLEELRPPKRARRERSQSGLYGGLQGAGRGGMSGETARPSELLHLLLRMLI